MDDHEEFDPIKLPGFNYKIPEYGKGKEYWDEHYLQFIKLGIKTSPHIETYCDIEKVSKEVKEVLKQALRKNDKILEIGCGLSTFGVWVCKNLDCRMIVCSDISGVAVRERRKRFIRLAPQIQFAEIDCQMLQNTIRKAYTKKDIIPISLETDENKWSQPKFDCIIDKGCLDTLFCHKNWPNVINKFINELSHILLDGGRYIFITDMQPDARLIYFPDDSWDIIETLPLQSNNANYFIVVLMIKK